MKKKSKDNEFDFSSAENQNNAGSPRKKSEMSAKRKAWIYSVRALMTAATGITLAPVSYTHLDVYKRQR